MVRKISKEEEDDIYGTYTIQPLHAPTLIGDLFPQAVGGLNQAREIALGVADYVKVLLMSRSSPFRLNLQF